MQQKSKALKDTSTTCLVHLHTLRGIRVKLTEAQETRAQVQQWEPNKDSGVGVHVMEH